MFESVLLGYDHSLDSELTHGFGEGKLGFLMYVVLFDIDGTLISTGGAGGAALMGAFCDTFAIGDPRPVKFSGRTDRAISGDLFQLHGLANNEENWGRLRDGYLERLPGELARRSGKILPGIESLLDTLTSRSDVLIGLLTGNLPDGARIKLEHFGIYQFFPFGAFGEQHENRDDVARDALQLVQQRLAPQTPQRGQTWVIGDTPFDVQCARAIGCRALAVATGVHERDELALSEPDLLLDDLTIPGPWLQQLSAR
ncbi:MAG: HAD hydrolase-like protein [Planctomycetota bacterium]|nr:HAD hydrolase-like protein [Planctomycetota bacterium]